MTLVADALGHKWELKKKQNIFFYRPAKADTNLHMQAFSREHFVGLEMFSNVISSQHFTFHCGHKLGAEKKKIIMLPMLTFFSSSECAHD